MKTRILSLVLVLSMVLTLFAGLSLTASAETISWVKTDLENIGAEDVVLIVYTKDSKNYAMQNYGTPPKPTEVTVSEERIISTVADNLQWNINYADGQFTAQPNGNTTNYLYCSNANNGVMVGTSTDNNSFIIDSDSGYIYNLGTERYLGLYNTQDFRCYTSVNNNIKDQTVTFYVKQISEEPEIVDFTALAAKIAEADALKAEDYTSESWAILSTALDAAKAVKDSGSSTQAEVNDALAALTEAMEQLIPVVDAGEEWLKTDLADILSTDTAVIVYTKNNETFAMSNSDVPPKPVSVSVSNGKIVSKVTENVKWNIDHTDGTFTAQPNGDTSKYLYCTDSNNGVKIGNNTDSNTFTIDTDSGYIYNLATERYLGLYNTQDFRCYTSVNNNIADQSVAFYVLQVTPVVLDSITLSGDYRTTFNKNTAFNHDGLIVTAHYDDASEKDVTADVTITEPDMSIAGTKTVTVSYTEGEVTKTATYDITVTNIDLVTIYIADQTYTSELYYYAYGTGGETHAWHGEKMEFYGTDWENWWVWKVIVDRSLYQTVIFNNNGDKKTTDEHSLNLTGVNGNQYAAYLNGEWVLYPSDLYMAKDKDGNEISNKVPATCTEDGSITYPSVLGGEDKVVVVPKTGHNWSEWEPTDPYTREHTRRCLNEGCNQTDTKPCDYVDGKCQYCQHAEPTKYTVTFMANGSQFTTITDYAGAEISLPVNVPAVLDYQFVGWVSDVNAADASAKISSYVMGEADATLYALYCQTAGTPEGFYLVEGEYTPSHGDRLLIVGEITEGEYAGAYKALSNAPGTAEATVNDKMATASDSCIWYVGIGENGTYLSTDKLIANGDPGAQIINVKALKLNSSALAFNNISDSSANTNNTGALEFIQVMQDGAAVGFAIRGAYNTLRYLVFNGTFSKGDSTGKTTVQLYKYQEGTGSTTYATLIPCFAGASLAVDSGYLKLNFYAQNVNEDYYVTFTGPTGYVDANEKYYFNGGKVTYPVAYKDYDKTVTAKLFIEGASEPVCTLEYSVFDYLKYDNYHEDTDEADVVSSLYDLCRLVQATVGKQTTVPDGVSVAVVQPVAANDAEMTGEGNDTVTYYGSSLLMRDEIVIRHYFTFNGSAEGYTAEGGELTRLSETSKYYYIDVSNIGAKNLSTKYTVVLKDAEDNAVYTINYSALSYANKVISSNQADPLLSTAYALYAYNAAAVDYFS